MPNLVILGHYRSCRYSPHGETPKDFDPHAPPFKVTEGHWEPTDINWSSTHGFLLVPPTVTVGLSHTVFKMNGNICKIFCPPRRWLYLEICNGDQTVKKCDDMSIHLDTVLASGQTDGRTELVKQYRAVQAMHCMPTRNRNDTANSGDNIGTVSVA